MSYVNTIQYAIIYSSQHKNKDINSFFARQKFYNNWILFFFKTVLGRKPIKIIKLLIGIKEKHKNEITMSSSNVDKVERVFIRAILNSLLIIKIL